MINFKLTNTAQMYSFKERQQKFAKYYNLVQLNVRNWNQLSKLLLNNI